MTKILTLILMASLFSVNTLSANPATENGGKTKPNQIVKADTLSESEEALLNKIHQDAEEIYYAKPSAFLSGYVQKHSTEPTDIHSGKKKAANTSK